MTYNEGDISWPACHIKNLGIFINSKSQKFLHQSLRISVAHDCLALIEILKILKQKIDKILALISFLISLTVGQ